MSTYELKYFELEGAKNQFTSAMRGTSSIRSRVSAQWALLGSEDSGTVREVRRQLSDLSGKLVVQTDNVSRLNSTLRWLMDRTSLAEQSACGNLTGILFDIGKVAVNPRISLPAWIGFVGAFPLLGAVTSQLIPTEATWCSRVIKDAISKGAKTGATALGATMKAVSHSGKTGALYKAAAEAVGLSKVVRHGRSLGQINKAIKNLKFVKVSAKVGKALGVVGSLAGGASTYLDRREEYGEVSAVADGVAHTAAGLGSVAAGAAIGSAIPIPVVGTVAGAVAGYAIGGALKTVWDGFAHNKWSWDNFKLW